MVVETVVLVVETVVVVVVAGVAVFEALQAGSLLLHVEKEETKKFQPTQQQ